MAIHSPTSNMPLAWSGEISADVTKAPIALTGQGAPRQLIVSDALMNSPHLVQLPGLNVCLFTTRSPNKETTNEDVVGAISTGENQIVLAVADGLGGHACGEVAAKRAVETLFSHLDTISETLQRDRSPDTSRAAILSGIESANHEVMKIGGGAATTLTVVEVHQDRIRSYHVGDSVTMLFGQRGRIKLQTIPHSPVGYAVESGMIAEEEAIHHEDRHVVSNVIGSEAMRIEIGPTINMARRDTLLLASDGLVDNLLPHEIVERVRKGPLHKAVQKLADTAAYRMKTPTQDTPSKPDDLSIIALRQS